MLSTCGGEAILPTATTVSRMGVENQLDAMFSPTVQLRSAAAIVIDQYRSLVSIDVNSGRSTVKHHIEDTALKTNLEASERSRASWRLTRSAPAYRRSTPTTT